MSALTSCDISKSQRWAGCSYSPWHLLSQWSTHSPIAATVATGSLRRETPERSGAGAVLVATGACGLYDLSGAIYASEGDEEENDNRGNENE